MGRIILPEVSSSPTPPSGKVSVYAKTDGLIYAKDDAGTETQLGGGGGSGLPSGGSVGQLLSLDGSGDPFWVDRPPGIAKVVASGIMATNPLGPIPSISVPSGSGTRTVPIFVTTAPTGYGIMRITATIVADVMNGANGNGVTRSFRVVPGFGLFPSGGPADYYQTYPIGSNTALLWAQGSDHVSAPTGQDSLTGGYRLQVETSFDVIFTRANLRGSVPLNGDPPSLLNTAGDAVLVRNVRTHIRANPTGAFLGSIVGADSGLGTGAFATDLLNVGQRKIAIGLTQSAQLSGNTAYDDGGVNVRNLQYHAEWLPFPGTPNANNAGSFGSEIG